MTWCTNGKDQISPIKWAYHQLKGKEDKPLSLQNRITDQRNQDTMLSANYTTITFAIVYLLFGNQLLLLSFYYSSPFLTGAFGPRVFVLLRLVGADDQ